MKKVMLTLMMVMGIIISAQAQKPNKEEKRDAYLCDILYSTNNELEIEWDIIECLSFKEKPGYWVLF